MSILNFLGLSENAPAGDSTGETETVRKIVNQLDGLEPERARYVAAFAYVLSRVAHADLKISKEETHSMERILMAMGNLPEEQAILVVQMAKTQALLFAGTENFLVTRELETLADREQKLKILRCLFAVSAADESISGAEETEIRKIADELRISRKDYLEVKLTYREYLSVLKHPPGT